LIRKEENSLETEFTVAKVEQVLQRRTEEVKNHRVVVAFGPEPSNERNTNATCKGLVDLGLVFKLGMLGFD
jgi:phosphomannomutase